MGLEDRILKAIEDGGPMTKHRLAFRLRVTPWQAEAALLALERRKAVIRSWVPEPYLARWMINRLGS